MARPQSVLCSEVLLYSKMGTPVRDLVLIQYKENGPPGSLFSWNYGDPFMKFGTPAWLTDSPGVLEFSVQLTINPGMWRFLCKMGIIISIVADHSLRVLGPSVWQIYNNARASLILTYSTACSLPFYNSEREVLTKALAT